MTPIDVMLTYAGGDGFRRAAGRLALVTWLAEKAAGRIARLAVQNVSETDAMDLKALSPLIEWHWLPRACSQRTRSIHAESWARTPIYVLADDDLVFCPWVFGRPSVAWPDYVAQVFEAHGVVQAMPWLSPDWPWPPDPHPRTWIGDRDLIRDPAVGACRFVRKGCGLDDSLPPLDPEDPVQYDGIRNARMAQYGPQGTLARLTGIHLGWGRSELKPAQRRDR